MQKATKVRQITASWVWYHIGPSANYYDLGLAILLIGAGRRHYVCICLDEICEQAAQAL